MRWFVYVLFLFLLRFDTVSYIQLHDVDVPAANSLKIGGDVDTISHSLSVSVLTAIFQADLG